MTYRIRLRNRLVSVTWLDRKHCRVEPSEIVASLAKCYSHMPESQFFISFFIIKTIYPCCKKKKNLNNIEGIFPLSPAPFPPLGLATTIYSLVCILSDPSPLMYRHLHINRHIIVESFVFCFCFTKMNSYYVYDYIDQLFFTQDRITKIFPYAYTQIYFFLLNGSRAGMHHHLFNQTPLVGQLSCLRFFTITEQVARNTLLVHSCILVGVFLWERFLEEKLLGWSQTLSILWLFKSTSIWDTSVYCLWP